MSYSGSSHPKLEMLTLIQEPDHKPEMNKGTVIKINANARYATNCRSISPFAAFFHPLVALHEICGLFLQHLLRRLILYFESLSARRFADSNII